MVVNNQLINTHLKTTNSFTQLYMVPAIAKQSTVFVYLTTYEQIMQPGNLCTVL